MEYGAGEVAGEKQVAGGAYMQDRLRQGLEIQVIKVFGLVVLYKASAGHFHAESVLRAEIVNISPGNQVLFFSNVYLQFFKLYRVNL